MSNNRRRSYHNRRNAGSIRHRERSPYGYVNRRSRNRRREIRRRRAMIIGFFVVLALLVYVAIYFHVSGYVKKQGSNAVCQNIYIDETAVSGMTKEQVSEVLQEHIKEQGKQKLVLQLEKEEMTVKLSELGLYIEDMDALVEKAWNYGKEGSIWNRYSSLKKLNKTPVRFEADYAIDNEKVQSVLEKKMEKVNKGTVDATLSRKDGTFVITDEIVGITVDMEKSKSVIEAYFEGDWKSKSGTIDLIATTDAPKITREDLEQVQDVLGQYTTVCGYGGGRVQNIETGASKIDGTLLMPDEELSADALMRPYTKENGFAEAGSYENGKVVQSMGGGICQVSSTLYNAVLLAELEVTQRAPHSMLVTYVEPAMDAAIAGDYKDLKFKNNTDAPIYVEGYVSGGKITFVIYGKETRDSGRTIEYVSETLETKKPNPTYQESKDAIGTIKQVSSAHIGKTAKLWKIVYENGKQVSKEVVNTSKYSSSPAVYAVGTKSDNAEAVKIVKAGIKTQKEDKVKASVAEAKSVIKSAEDKKNEKKTDDKKDNKTDNKKQENTEE